MMSLRYGSHSTSEGKKNTAANKPSFYYHFGHFCSFFLFPCYGIKMWKTVCLVLCRSEVQELGDKFGKILWYHEEEEELILRS